MPTFRILTQRPIKDDEDGRLYGYEEIEAETRGKARFKFLAHYWLDFDEPIWIRKITPKPCSRCGNIIVDWHRPFPGDPPDFIANAQLCDSCFDEWLKE